MKHLFTLCILLLLAAPAFGESAIVKNRKEADTFRYQCLSPAEQSSVHFAPRVAPMKQEGFTLFFDKYGNFACKDKPAICSQRCGPPAPDR